MEGLLVIRRTVWLAMAAYAAAWISAGGTALAVAT
jgi:hypothetical protein